MSLNEIVYNLTQSDDPIVLEKMAFTVLYYRDLLLRRDDERTYRIPSGMLQLLALTPATDGALFSSTMPTVCEAKEGPAITYVGPPDFSGSYSYCEREAIPYFAASKYTATVPRFCLVNNKLVVSQAGAVSVHAVFYDPRVVFALQGIADVDDYEGFPITGSLVQRISAGIMSGELALKSPPTPIVVL